LKPVDEFPSSGTCEVQHGGARGGAGRLRVGARRGDIDSSGNRSSGTIASPRASYGAVSSTCAFVGLAYPGNSYSRGAVELS
jgi:hypothetical protein